MRRKRGLDAVPRGVATSGAADHDTKVAAVDAIWSALG